MLTKNHFYEIRKNRQKVSLNDLNFTDTEKKMSAVYLVKTPNKQRLIKANSRSVAINFAVRSEVTAKSVTASEMVDLLQSGMTIEDASPKEVNENQPNIEGV